MSRCWIVTVSWAGRPFLSELISSSLKVTGLVQEIDLVEANGANDYSQWSFEVYNESMDSSSSSSTSSSWNCTIQWDVQKDRPAQKWLCLLLKTEIQVDNNKDSEAFLILDPAGKTASESIYRRVGLGIVARRKVGCRIWRFDLDKRAAISLV